MTHRLLDFAPVRAKEKTFQELVTGLTLDDLRELTNGMVDTIHDLIAEATDADVVFNPEDPGAEDTYAATEEERNIAWNLGHLVVHVTASSEESAALGAEMARGVEREGRSRSEIPWQDVTTIQQCRDRLEESRRMCLASLEMWPDQPYYDVTSALGRLGEVNCLSRFVLGLGHADSHLAQIEEVVRQAKVARGA